MSNEKIVPAASNRNGNDFNVMQHKWSTEENNNLKGIVPASLYFLVNNESDIIGSIQLRHRLSEKLLLHGGHIGYGIRPSERMKGYASIMLYKILLIVKNTGIDKVLITCDDDNIGSIKTIENNNGVLQDKIEFNNKLTRRYWIYL